MIPCCRLCLALTAQKILPGLNPGLLMQRRSIVYPLTLSALLLLPLLQLHSYYANLSNYIPVQNTGSPSSGPTTTALSLRLIGG